MRAKKRLVVSAARAAADKRLLLGSAASQVPAAFGEVAPTSPLSAPLYMNEHQIAAYLGMTVEAIRRWRLRGKGPPYCKLVGAVRYRRDDLDAWAVARRVNSTTEAEAKGISKPRRLKAAADAAE